MTMKMMNRNAELDGVATSKNTSAAAAAAAITTRSTTNISNNNCDHNSKWYGTYNAIV